MKKLIALIFISCFYVAASAAQQPQPQQQQQGQPQPRVIIQTPFGPKEEPAPQQTPAPPAAPVPQTPAPTTPPAAPGPAAAQPAQTPAPAPGQADEVVPISLQLDNADIHQIIRIIANALNINYIVDPAVRGTVNISTAGNLRRSDLLPILETILKINGATMIRTGNFYQIVPATTAARQPLQVEERNVPPAPDDQMVMQIVRMKFVTAAEMSSMLTPYVSEGGNIVVHAAGNILIITERRSNLRKLLELIDVFDSNILEGGRLRLLPVKNNLARDLVTDLKTIFSGYALSESATAIRFVPIERMNSILVVSPNPAVFPEVEKWLERLDLPLQNAGIRNFVYKVRNAKAADIQSVLGQLYGGQVQVSTVSTTPQSQAGFGPATGATQTPPASATPSTAVIQRNVRIIADLVNNALVIQASPQDYAEIERTLRELDVLPRQVLIDAQIYEVVLDDSLALGLSAILQNRGTLANPQTTASFAGAPPSFSGQTFAFVGRARELLAFVNATENRSRVRTLSAPSVLVSDNMTADFQVGAEVPVPTTSSITPVQSSGTNLFAQTISFRPTGVLMRVKPQINDSGNVTLEVSQEVSQANANTTSGVVAPVIGKSSVSSSIVVQDGQTIALGGFIRENQELARSRIPLLGRIPVAGVLFGNTRRATTRTELIVLITPHVLRSHEEADLATDELKDKLREVKKLLR